MTYHQQEVTTAIDNHRGQHRFIRKTTITIARCELASMKISRRKNCS